MTIKLPTRIGYARSLLIIRCLLLVITCSSFITDVYAVIDEASNMEELFTTDEEVNIEDKTQLPLTEPSSVDIPVDDKLKSDAISSNNEMILKNYDKAKVIALNKITAKSKEMTLAIEEVQYFGNIEIKIHRCVKNLDPYAPDDKVLLTIMENKTEEDPIMVFQGWMISSNIGISTLEHPVYEVFIKECL
ncbi:DUF2155 domain-containing protein [Candidatus Trichorickettsia mobilis]|uniref:DUF2155 domain-containing protein n=1 Tax=Candidatus Trichorickettsia mobilis TaxID=1346319 RepID=A0ABZ0UT22_9RICK|nr:DUF2155 domain-containing protein [Candidatus Trichorickettsia mobilis]WPY01172.1 DUF2155 domain-containing protein [Candidatus Trichorickettsia mobilis]